MNTFKKAVLSLVVASAFVSTTLHAEEIVVGPGGEDVTNPSEGGGNSGFKGSDTGSITFKGTIVNPSCEIGIETGDRVSGELGQYVVDFRTISLNTLMGGGDVRAEIPLTIKTSKCSEGDVAPSLLFSPVQGSLTTAMDGLKTQLVDGGADNGTIVSLYPAGSGTAVKFDGQTHYRASADGQKDKQNPVFQFFAKLQKDPSVTRENVKVGAFTAIASVTASYN